MSTAAPDTAPRLHLTLPRKPGTPLWQHRVEEQMINADPEEKPRAKRQLADLIKRQAKEALRAVTECAPAALPANLARIRDLDEIILLAIRLDLTEEPEADLSDPAPVAAHTLGDFRLAIQCARELHRAPAFVSATAAELAGVNRRLDAIAGLLAGTLPKGGVQ